jgi:hypothetical protein
MVFSTPTSKARFEWLISLGLVPGPLILFTQNRLFHVIEIGETTLPLDEEMSREI